MSTISLATAFSFIKPNLKYSALLGAIVFSTVAFLVPHTEAADKGGKVDWMGSYLGEIGRAHV